MCVLLSPLFCDTIIIIYFDGRARFSVSNRTHDADDDDDDCDCPTRTHITGGIAVNRLKFGEC